MGLIDKITGKTEEPKKKTSKKQEANVLDMVKETPAQKPVAIKENTGHAYHVLKSGHLSEKTNQLSSLNRYVFMVDRKSNKIEVRKAVEATYDVKVVAVNIVNIRGKARRFGRVLGTTSARKKAIVTLKPGDKIAGLTEGV